jgi:anti-sigma factor RsiW
MIPPELTDRDLLAYLDGEADPQVAEHLERCPHCRQRAARLAHLQGHLTAQLYRLVCPPPQELGEYHLGLLAADRAAAVAYHLAECPHCTREIAQLQDYLADLSPALDLSQVERVVGRVRVLVARLLAAGDEAGWPGQPSLAPALPGLRGAEAGPLIYQADGLQVLIQIQEDVQQPGRKTILGLVTGLDNPHQLEVHVWQAGQRIATAPVDELGNFALSNVTPGSYELILSGPEVEIHIQALDI